MNNTSQDKWFVIPEKYRAEFFFYLGVSATLLVEIIIESIYL
jgi:hypothetical protein